MSLGSDFYAAAAYPVCVMVTCSRQGNYRGALAAVHYDALAGAFHAAVDRVRRQAGVSREAVVILLPDVQMHAAVLATNESYQRALVVWNQHQNSLTAVVGRALGAVFDFKVGVQGSGIGDAFMSVMNSVVQDVRLKEPFADLAAALQDYDEWLRWCISILDGDIALNETYAKTTQRRRWIKIACAVGTVGLVGGGFAIYRSTLSPVPSAPSATVVTVEMPPSTSVLAPLASASTLNTRRAPPVAPIRAAPGKPLPSTPAAATPASRAACLRTCIATCHDDASCERTCAASCPPS